MERKTKKDVNLWSTECSHVTGVELPFVQISEELLKPCCWVFLLLCLLTDWLTDWLTNFPSPTPQVPTSWFFSTTAPFSQLQHHKNWCRERLDICSNLYSTACRKQRICWLIPLDSRYGFFFGFALLIESLHWFPVHNCFSGACWLVFFLNCDLLFWFSRKTKTIPSCILNTDSDLFANLANISKIWKTNIWLQFARKAKSVCCLVFWHTFLLWQYIWA